MAHLCLAWIWVMAGLLVGVARLRTAVELGWIAVLLPLCCLCWLRSPWRAALQPQGGVKALCWFGHGLMAGPVLVVFVLLAMPSLHDGHAFGLGLLAALLLMPLPWIGAAAWILQIIGLLRHRPAGH